MRRFPVRYNSENLTKEEYIPLAMMIEHENQCIANYGQNVDKLAQNGGTNYLETYFILKDKFLDLYLEDGDDELLESRAKNLVQGMAYRWLMENGLLNQIDI
jgi:hypothetical protein